MAGAANLPFFPLASYVRSDLPKVNPLIRPVRSPFDERDLVYAVPSLNPDVAILHAQRADEQGNTQIWSLVGVAKVAFASQHVVVVVEEVEPSSVMRADPNRDSKHHRGRRHLRALRRAAVARPGFL